MSNPDVTKTLATMIANWPTLYETRLDALLRVFTDTADWNRDGTPEPDGLNASTTKDFDDEDEAVAKDVYADEQRDPVRFAAASARVRLRVRKYNAHTKFIRDNAVTIAEADGDFRGVPDLSMFSMNRLPMKTMTAAWKAALVEVCKAVIAYREEAAKEYSRKYAPAYQQQTLDRLAASKATAQECLFRIAPELSAEESKRLRTAEIEKLRYAAEKLGLKLVPVE